MADEAKAKSNVAFSSGDFNTAVKHFTEVINLSPTNHVLYSNHSSAFASLHQYDVALSDTKKTVDLKPDWSKGCSRLGAAHLGLHQYQEDVSAYKKGMEIDPNNEAFKTGVANEINQQPICTVLVVDNTHMSELSGLSPDASKNTLSLQVVLEYYDETKLRNMHFKRPLLLTTLYQQSGKAQHHQGFLKMKTEGSGQVAFGSAPPGSYLDITFVEQFTATGGYDYSGGSNDLFIVCLNLSPCMQLQNFLIPFVRS